MSINKPQDQRIPGFYNDRHVRPECTPFSLEEGHSEVVLFIHGLTGSPEDFRVYAQQYLAAGFDVFTPLWPGHGSHISILERLTYRELYIPFPPLMAYLRERYRKVHVTALSYGSIIATDMALSQPGNTLSFLAPAFYLTVEKEKKISLLTGLRVHRLAGRVRKKKIDHKGRPIKRVTFTYDAMPARAVLELHRRCAAIRDKVATLDLPIYHAHGDEDDTTPYHSNVQFLSRVVSDYTFYHVPQGHHILPVDPGREAMARHHIQWLKGR